MRKAYVALFIVWLLAAASLIGIHLFLKERNSPPKKANPLFSLIESMDETSRKSLSYFDTGVIILSDDKYHFIGKGFEVEENRLIELKKLSSRNIDIVIDDPVLLERTILSTEAFKLLNNAEKKCVSENSASLVYRNGSFRLLFDPIRYKENVRKYGTDCKPCEALKNKIKKSK